MINKDMTVGEVLRSCSDAAMDAVVKIFTDMGMHWLCGLFRRKKLSTGHVDNTVDIVD